LFQLNHLIVSTSPTCHVIEKNWLDVMLVTTDGSVNISDLGPALVAGHWTEWKEQSL
jgi:hypothetical protein